MWVVVALMLATPAWGERFWSPRDLLGVFCAESESVRPVRLVLSESERDKVGGRGIPATAREEVLYVARTADVVDALVYFGEEMGMHEPISFAVLMSPDGVVLRHEVVEYRERRGGEVRQASFREQFVGKRLDDPLRVGEDIDAVSGATRSSRAMASGVRRALAVAEVWRTHRGESAGPHGPEGVTAVTAP